jgi:hypothetical protein
MLADLGVSDVLLAHNPTIALGIAQRVKIDFVLIDLALGNQPSYAVADALAAWCPISQRAWRLRTRMLSIALGRCC